MTQTTVTTECPCGEELRTAWQSTAGFCSSDCRIHWHVEAIHFDRVRKGLTPTTWLDRVRASFGAGGHRAG